MNIAVRPQTTILETHSGRPVEIDILQLGYSMVKVDPAFVVPRITAVRHGLQRITDDPELVKLFPYQKAFKQDAYGPRYALDVGLTQRNDTEHKWFFHHTPDAYPEDKLPVPCRSEYGSFFKALRDLNTKAVEIAIAIAERFDARNHEKHTIYKYPGSMAEVFRAGECVDRGLRYLMRQETARVDAKPHIDRCGIACDWGASHGGLYILRKSDKKWIEADITRPGFVAVFPGEKFGAITRGVLGFGTPHGVKYERVDNRDRYAVISFMHPAARLEHAQWLEAHREMIEQYEATLRIS